MHAPRFGTQIKLQTGTTSYQNGPRSTAEMIEKYMYSDMNLVLKQEIANTTNRIAIHTCIQGANRT